MTVADWGTSKPDFFQITTPAKTIVGTEELYQVKWDYWDLITVDADSSTSIDAYTVPSDYELHLGGGTVSCNISCMQMIRLLRVPSADSETSMLGDYRFDMRADIVLSELTTHILDTGDRLDYHLFNYLAVPANFSVSLTGFLVK